jgi:hypothetical protein
VIANLQVSVENQSAARSRIMDADFAAETANLSRAQILQQAGNAMVAQANQLPQQVLRCCMWPAVATPAPTRPRSRSAQLGHGAGQLCGERRRNWPQPSMNAWRAPLPSSTTAIGEGTLTIEHRRLGRAGPPQLHAEGGHHAVTISIGTGEDTLAAIRDKINNTAAWACAPPSSTTPAAPAGAAVADHRRRERLSVTGHRRRRRATRRHRPVAPGLRLARTARAVDGAQPNRRQCPATINGLPIESASNALSASSTA